jgi:histidinol-phosphate aminotransferase
MKSMTTKVKPQSGLDSIRPYVPGTPIEEVQREYGLEDVIKLASNENPLGTSPKALAAIEAALSRLNQYPDSLNYYVRHGLAGELGVDPEQLVMGNGADGVIMQICMAYLDQDDEVIVSQSSFPVYDVFVHTMRAKLIKVPMAEGFRLDLEAMAEAINERTKIVFICNPNNPTGTIVTQDEVDAFMARVPDDVLVVFDEAYYELVDSDAYPETFQYIRQERGNVIILRTFSKVYGMAGVRLGYGIGVPELLAPLKRSRESFGVNLLAQAAGLAALEDKAFLEETVAMNHQGRLYLYEAFERLGLEYVESHTNFILVRIGPRAGEVQQELLKKGVIVRPCTGYDLPEYLRVTVGSPAQNERFVEALEDLL